MTLSTDIRLLVRRRANYACEYCGVTEIDAGGELTIDHFRPQSEHGSDDAQNLLYSCLRCNLYKADYWPRLAGEALLWNPREHPREEHLLELADASLYAISDIGQWTLSRLRLNRPQLVEYRRRRAQEIAGQSLLNSSRIIISTLKEVQQQQARLLKEQRQLLMQQRKILRLLSGSADDQK
jgi:hypothetical protein